MQERALSLPVPPRNTQTHKPLKIAGMSLVAERPHNKYGSAILIRDNLKVDNICERVQGTVELITIVMSGIVVHYVYKPPNDQFTLSSFGHIDLPHIVIEDFNSHSTSWCYDTTYNNGEAVEQWEDSCDLTLIHDAKQPKSFNSARWKKGYNPDLIFASGSIANMCKKSIMNPIPHTQHRPICVTAQRNSISLFKTLNIFQATLFCRECTCSIQKTHTKKMSNRIRFRSY